MMLQLKRPNLVALQVTLPELQSLIASPASKARFSLKLDSTAQPDSTNPSDYLIRANPAQAPQQPPSTATAPTLTPLTATTDDLPALIVYETSYANYPLILASGGIKRAGGQAHLVFKTVAADGEERERAATDADVSIYVDLREVMEAEEGITWARTDSGMVVTEGDAAGGAVEKRFWKKVVARRADIGVLFEDGEVRKEVPIGLRGKGVKAKKGGKGKGRGLKQMKARGEDEESASSSD